jgi:hypothetical protein
MFSKFLLSLAHRAYQRRNLLELGLTDPSALIFIGSYSIFFLPFVFAIFMVDASLSKRMGAVINRDSF